MVDRAEDAAKPQDGVACLYESDAVGKYHCPPALIVGIVCLLQAIGQTACSIPQSADGQRAVLDVIVGDDVVVRQTW